MGSALVETMFVRPLSDSEACHPLVFNLCELWVPQAVMPAGAAKVTRGRLGNPGVRARFLLLRETQSHPLWGQGCQELVAPNPGSSGPGSAREGGHPFRGLQSSRVAGTEPGEGEHSPSGLGVLGAMQILRTSCQDKAKAARQQFSGSESFPWGGHREALSLPSPWPEAGGRGHTDGTPFGSVVTLLPPHAKSTVSCCKVSFPYPWTPGVSRCAYLHRCVGRSWWELSPSHTHGWISSPSAFKIPDRASF